MCSSGLRGLPGERSPSLPTPESRATAGYGLSDLVLRERLEPILTRTFSSMMGDMVPAVLDSVLFWRNLASERECSKEAL